MAKRNVGTVQIGVRLVSSALEGDVRKVQQQLRRLGRQIESNGKTLTKNLTVPMAAAGAVATKFAMDFNKSMANVSTMLKGGEQQLSSYKKSIQDLSVTSGKSTKDLADGMYSVISSLGESSDNIKQLGIATKASVAGISSTTDAISLLALVSKNYGSGTAPEMERTSNLAFKAVADGVTTFAELSASLGKVTPLAASFNVTQEELFAIMGAGTGVAGNTAEVVTSLKAAINSTITPTKELQEVLTKIGMTGQEMIQEKGLIGAWKEFQKVADQMGIPFAKLTSSSEALNLMLTMTGSQYEKFIQGLADSQGVLTTTSDAYKKQIEGINKFGFELEQNLRRGIVILQDLGDAIIDNLGDDINNSIKSILDVFQGLIDKFKSLDAETQKFTITMAAFSATLGPLLTGLGIFVALLGSVVLIKIGLVTVAISALGAAIWTFQHEILRNINQELVSFYKGLADVAKGLYRISDALGMKGAGEGYLKLAYHLEKMSYEADQAVKAFDNQKDAVKKLTDVQKTAVDQAKELIQDIPTLGGKVRALTKAWSDGAFEIKKVVTEEEKLRLKELELTKAKRIAADATKKQTEELEEEEKAITRLEKAYSEMLGAFEVQDIQKKMSEALSTGDKKLYNELSESLAKVTSTGMINGLDDVIKKSGEKGEKIAKEMRGDRYDRVIKESTDRLVDYETEQRKKKTLEAVEFWQSAFSNAITGQTFDWESSLDKMLSGVAAGFAADLLGGMEDGILSMEQLGQDVGKKIAGWISGALGENVSGQDVMGAAMTGMNIFSSIRGAKGRDKGTGTREGTGGAVGAGVGAAAGLALTMGNPMGAAIGSMIGETLGSFVGSFMHSAPSHPETLGRIEAFEMLNERMQGGFGFVDQGGKERRIDKLNLGGFEGMKEQGWAERLEKEFGSDAFLSAIGLGEALEEMLGLTEDVGAQIGASLLENVGGSVDALRMLMLKLDVSAEEVTDSLFQIGLTGEMSWHEVYTMIDKVNGSIGEGLSGVADLSGALKGLKASAGVGIEAIESLRNIAIEGMEGDITTLEQLQQQLAATGVYTADEIQMIMDSLSKNGVGTLEELKNANDQTLGAIVADLETMGIGFESTRQQLEGMVSTYQMFDDLEDLEKNIKINFEMNDPDNVRGLLQSTNILDGEQSLTGSNLRSSTVELKSQRPTNLTPTVIYNIDATNAEVGVSQEILSALQETEENAVTRAVNIVEEMSGGNY